MKKLGMAILAFALVIGMISHAAEPAINSVLSLDFDNVAGSIIPDTSGAGNNGEFQDEYGAGIMFIEGPFGQAVQLDGASQFIEVPANVFDRDEVTIAFWIHWEGGIAWQRIFEVGSLSADAHITFVPRTHEDIMSFQSWNAAAQHAFVATPADSSSFPTNEWVHVAITQDANTLTRIYFNGNPLALDLLFWTAGDSHTLENVTEFVAGTSFRYVNSPTNSNGEDNFSRFGHSATAFWDAPMAGSFNAVHVFNGVLSQEQITSLMEHNSPFVAASGSDLPWVWIATGTGAVVIIAVIVVVVLKKKR